MAERGLGRGLGSMAELSEHTPDLSGFVTSEDPHALGDTGSAKAAVVWMLIGSVAFGAMNAMVKWTDDFDIGVPTVIMVRSAVIAGLAFAWASVNSRTLRIVSRRKMMLRCTTGLVAMFCYFYALQRIPITQAVSLQYTAPLFVALLSGRVLKERVSPWVVACVAIAFVGVALIISPRFGEVEPDALFALASGFLAAMAYMYVRDLRSTDSPTGVVFWFAAFSAAVSLPLAIRETVTLGAEEMLILIGVGLGAGLGQVGITMAYQQAKAAWIAAFSYTTVLVASFFGWLFFDEVLLIDDYIGALLIIGTGVALILMTPQNARTEP
jgi:drug/metabolite transporter (DMT)-like permease